MGIEPQSDSFRRYLDASEALGQDPDAPNPLVRQRDDGRCPHCGALMLVGWQPCRPVEVVREWTGGDTRGR